MVGTHQGNATLVSNQTSPAAFQRCPVVSSSFFISGLIPLRLYKCVICSGMIGMPPVAFCTRWPELPCRINASWWDNWVKSRVSCLCRACTLWVKWNISLACSLVSPDIAENHTQLHGCGWPTAGDKWICAGWSNHSSWGCKHLYVHSPSIWRKKTPCHIKRLNTKWIRRCVMWSHWSGMEERRWQKTNTLWWVCASALRRSALIFKPLLLQMRMLGRTTWVQQICWFEHLAMFIVSGAWVVWAPTFGMCMVFMLPAPFPMPRIDLSVELFAYILTFLLRLFCVTPSSCRYGMLVTLRRTLMVSPLQRGIQFHLGTANTQCGNRRR